MLLVYYRLYITYTLAGFLFDLDQSNICRDIQKIERFGKTICVPDSSENIQYNKEAENVQKRVERYFPGFLAFIDCTEQQIPRPKNKRRHERIILEEKETCHKDTSNG